MTLFIKFIVTCVLVTLIESGRPAGQFSVSNIPIYVTSGQRVPIELFCSHEDATKLRIRKGSEDLPVEIVNQTTIRYFEANFEPQSVTFRCDHPDFFFVKYLSVVVGSPPQPVKKFRCVSKNLDELNCTWEKNDSFGGIPRRSQFHTNYDLTFLVNGQPMQSCEVSSFVESLSCTWYSYKGRPLYRQQMERYIFLMKSCNPWGCSNETFDIDHFSVVKPDRPGNIQVFNITAHSVVITWQTSLNILDLLPNGVDYKVEFWFYGVKPSRVNTSTLPTKRTNGLEIQLPCANKHYVVRVAMRPKVAVGEEFWSDFSSIEFFTGSETASNNAEVNEVCKTKVQSSEVLLYRVQLLRQNIHDELENIKKRVRLLKQRVHSKKQ